MKLDQNNPEFYQELTPMDLHHTQVRVESKNYGEYQIRIRKFKREGFFDIKPVKDEYDRINLYYKYVNNYYVQKCPSFYHYR